MKMRAFLSLGTILCSAPTFAQNIAAPGQESNSATSAQASPGDSQIYGDEDAIIITGGRPRGSVVGDIPPQNTLDARDVRATGATSVSELLDALAPQIGSSQGRGGEHPVILLNGQRISSLREMRDIPTEAIERVEVLPEEVALKYGYKATQKVVNIVLRERFRSTAVRGEGTVATAGGYGAEEGDLTCLMIGKAGRTTFNLHGENNGALTESERSIEGGNADQQAARTLLGSASIVRGSATVNRTLSQSVSATVNFEAEQDSGRSLLGLGASGLDSFGRDTRSHSVHAGTVVNGDLGKWRWSLTGNADWDRTRIATDRPDPRFGRDRSVESDTSGDLTAVANGSWLKLPAGDAGITLRLGALANHVGSRRTSQGAASETSLGRTQGNAAINVDLPVSRRGRDFSALGDLTVNANAEVQRMSDFGSLSRIGAGANWSPVERLELIGSWSREDGAPTVQQLGSPILETQGTRIFDFVNGETVLATVTTGGNPNLHADSRSVTKLGANWRPIKDTDIRIRADYVHSIIHRPIQSLFGPSPVLEAAFPGRFVRDGGGTLVSADLRPLNFNEARRDTLKVGLDFSKPLKSARPSPGVMNQLRAQFRGAAGDRRGSEQFHGRPAEPGAPTTSPPGGGQVPGGIGRGGRLFGGNRGRLILSLTDSITFVDTVSIAPGLPEIDYLRGDSAGSSGGTPRHKVEAQAGWFNNGFGLRLSGNWRSATEVSTSRAGTLHFSPVATLDARIFANLGERPQLLLKHPWLRGTSLRLEVTNLFDSKPQVRDSSGSVPPSYQPDLLDPLGRTVSLSIRKLFMPSYATMRRELNRETR